jgi:hypothetical protein
MTEIQSAQEDPDLFEWMQNVINGNPEQGIAPAGDFLKSLANAALHADWENYPMLRPILLQMKYKYPQYGPPD